MLNVPAGSTMAILREPKPKLCRAPGCEVQFTPRASFQKACSPKCALVLVRLDKQRQVRREKRAGRVKLRTVSDWTKLAQAEFNRFIRERDKALPCISCGRSTGAKRNAGHYLSAGSHPELRFNEDNCNGQCEHCNSWKSGNAVSYRVALVHKIGLGRVEALEGPHEPKRYRIDELIAIRDEYRRKWKALRA